MEVFQLALNIILTAMFCYSVWMRWSVTNYNLKLREAEISEEDDYVTSVLSEHFYYRGSNNMGSSKR